MKKCKDLSRGNSTSPMCSAKMRRGVAITCLAIFATVNTSSVMASVYTGSHKPINNVQKNAKNSMKAKDNQAKEKKYEELKEMGKDVLGEKKNNEAGIKEGSEYINDESSLKKGIKLPPKPSKRSSDEKGESKNKVQKSKVKNSKQKIELEAKKAEKFENLRDIGKTVLGKKNENKVVSNDEMELIKSLDQLESNVRLPQKPTKRSIADQGVVQYKSKGAQKAKVAKAPEAYESYTLGQLKSKSYQDMMDCIAGTSWENISDLFQNTAESKAFYNDTARFKYIMSDLATRAASFTENDDKGIPTIVEIIRSGFYLGYYNPNDFPGLWTNSMAELCMPAMRNILNNPACNYGTETQNGVIDALGALIGNSTCDTNITNQCTRLLRDFRTNYKTYLTDLSKANAVFKIMSGVGYVYYTESYSHYGEDPKKLPSFGKIDGFIDELIAMSELKDLSADDQWLADNGLYYMGQLGKFYSDQNKILQILTTRMDKAQKYSAEYFSAASQINENYGGKNARGEQINYAQLQNEGNEYWMPKHYTFDDGAIQIQAGDKVSPEKIKRMYWATKEVESQFFRVNGIDKPLEPNNKDKVLTIRLFNSPAEYKMNSYLNGISTDNGGMYIEPYGTFYTYERTKEESVYSLEELFRHEFTHYLQGKYQVPGMWGEGDFYKNNELEWFDEGTAEFFAGSTRTDGVKPREAIVGYLSSEPSKRFTLDKLFKSGYASGWDFYNYGWACISYLYNNDITKLHEINDAIVKYDINSFRTILKGVANNATTESAYQTYMQTMKDKTNIGTPLVSDAYTAAHSKRTLAEIKQDISIVTGISTLTEGVTNSKEFGTFQLEGKYSGTSTGDKTSDWKAMNKKANEMLTALSTKGWTGYETVTCYFTNYKVVNGQYEYTLVFRGLLNDGSPSTEKPEIEEPSTGGSDSGNVSKPSVLTKEIEPNDSIEQANKNGFIGNNVEVSASCSTTADRDHFVFEVDKNGKVDVKVTGGADKITWVVYKEGDLNSYVGWSQFTEGDVTSGSFDATPGKYILRVYPTVATLTNQEYKILINGIKSYSNPDSGSGSESDANLKSYTLAQLSNMSHSDMMNAIAGTKWSKISDLFKNTAESRAFFNDSARFKYIISDLEKRAAEFTATDDKGIPNIAEVLRSGFYLGYYNPNEFPELMKDSMTSLCVPAMEAILNNKNMGIDKTPAVLEALGALIGNTTVTPKIMDTVVDKVLVPFRNNSVDYLGDLKKSNAAYKLISSIGYVINTELYNNTGKPETSYPSYGKIDKYVDEMCKIAEMKIQYSDDQWYVDNGISYAAGYAFLHSNSDGIKTRLTTLMDTSEKYGATYMSLAYEICYNMGGKNSRGEEISFETIAKEADQHWLPNEYIFDDGAIVVHAGDKVSAEKIQRMYWATKEVESQFFRVNGNDKALEPNNTDKVLTIKLYNSPKEYKMNWYINFISTDNGGMYVEPYGTFYTYERTEAESVYSLEELFRHEFTHYLQGRYQVPGLWGQGDFYNNSDIEWFDEGTAEFFAGSTRTEGVKPRKAIVGYINKDASKRFTIDKLIKSGYKSGWEFYNYGWAYVSYLYNNDIETLAKINDSIMSAKIDDFRNILNNQAKNSNVEAGYQQYMENMKNDSTLTTPLVGDAYTAEHSKRTLAQIKEDISSATGINKLTESVINSKKFGTFKLEGKYSGTSTGDKTRDWKEMNKKADQMLKSMSSKGWSGYDTVTCYFTDYKVVNGMYEFNIVFRGLLNDGSPSTGGSGSGNVSKPSVITKEVEPNDSIEEASKNGFIGNNVELSAVCSDSQDRDHFAFEVEKNGKVNIKVTGGADKLTWVVYKEGDSNSYAAWAQYTEGNTTSGSFDATPGKYFIKVYPTSSNVNSQEYKVLIDGIKSYTNTDSGSGSGSETLPPAIVDGMEQEPNDDNSSANVISNEKDIKGKLTADGDNDIFAFEVQQDGNVDIRVNSASKQFTWVVYKETDESNLVCWSQYSDAQGSTGSFNATKGKYFIKVYSLNTQPIDYTLNVKGIK